MNNNDNNKNKEDGLAANDLFLNEDARFTKEEKNKIFKARAKALAKELRDEEIDSNSFEIIEFVLNDEFYGLNTKYVKQVAKVMELLKIYGVPQYVLGVTCLQEQIVSVIDIRTFLSFAQKEDQKEYNLIVLHSDNMEFAVSVDRIIGVRSLGQKNVQTAMEAMEESKKKYFYGITKDQVIILDADKILSDPEMVVS